MSKSANPQHPAPKPRKRSVAYLAQNKALFKAAGQLGLSLDELRDLAAEIDPLHRRSLSLLPLTQRNDLLVDLKKKGADIRIPTLTAYDLVEEVGSARRADRGGKLIRFPSVSAKEEQMLRTLAARVTWREADGFPRLCYKLIRAPFPRNHREVTTMRLALQSLLQQQQRQTTGATPDDAEIQLP